MGISTRGDLYTYIHSFPKIVKYMRENNDLSDERIRKKSGLHIYVLGFHVIVTGGVHFRYNLLRVGIRTVLTASKLLRGFDFNIF